MRGSQCSLSIFHRHTFSRDLWLTLIVLLLQFDNLILDETPLERLSADDKAYLQSFTKLEMISFNICRLQSLENFPVLSLLSRVSAILLRFALFDQCLLFCDCSLNVCLNCRSSLATIKSKEAICSTWQAITRFRLSNSLTTRLRTSATSAAS